MRTHQSRKLSNVCLNPCSALTVLLLLAAASPGAASETITWIHESQVQTHQGYTEVSCGSLGYYYLATGEPAGGVTENIVYYDRFEGGNAQYFAFGNQENNWVGMLDWNDKHGRSVAAAIDQLACSQVSVVLYNLDPTVNLSDLGLSGVTDGHVLAQLCALLEDVEDPLTPPPLVVNMSFGRYTPDAKSGKSESKPCSPDTHSLSCEIRTAIDTISGADLGSSSVRRTTFVAAAGNFHHKDLFPAVYEQVLDVGMLDATRFNHDGAVLPAWEGPKSVSALFPGAGLCIDPAGDPAPTGSSIAAAVASGVLAKALIDVPIDDPLAGTWRINTSCSQIGFGSAVEFESLDGSVIPFLNPVLSDLIDLLLDPQYQGCWDPVEIPFGYIEVAEDQDYDPLGTHPSLIEVFGETNAPQPTPIICGACPYIPVGGVLVGQPAGLVLTLDGAGFGPDLVLDWLQLRVGSETDSRLYSPDPASPELQQLIADIMDGETSTWAFHGFVRYPGESVSFVLTLSHTRADAAQQQYWTSVPLLLVNSTGIEDFCDGGE